MDVKPEGSEWFEQPSPEKYTDPLPALKLSSAQSFTSLKDDFALFTHALLFTHGLLDRDPLQDFLDETEKGPILSQITLDAPIFRGLELRGDPHWNRTLIAVEKWAWEACRLFLAGVAIKDSAKKSYSRVISHELKIVDALLLHKTGTLPDKVPMIGITVFGLIKTSGRSNRARRIFIQPANDPPVDLPSVVSVSHSLHGKGFAYD